MERTLIKNNNLDSCSGNILVALKSNDCVTLNVDSNANVLITELNENSTLNINLKDDASAKVSILSKNNVNNVKINANLDKNTEISMYFADFSTGKGKAKIEINLNKEGAVANWHLASLSATSDNKEFDVSIYHNSQLTYGHSDNYGVCKDDAKLVFSGISSIIKGAIKSKTNQNAKIMVFDKNSIAAAKPILKIDENDIEASHAAIVGKINDEHLFYLTSRGLTESEAKQLITFGYLKPIINGFDEDEIKEEITNLIEGRM